MAAVGVKIDGTELLAGQPDAISRTVIAGTANVPGYTVVSAGPGSIVLTRRYIPTWAIVLAVIGFVLILIGLLALLIKTTETLTVTLAPSHGGTQVTVSGTGSQGMLDRLTAVLGALPKLDAPGPSEAVTPAPL